MAAQTPGISTAFDGISNYGYQHRPWLWQAMNPDIALTIALAQTIPWTQGTALTAQFVLVLVAVKTSDTNMVTHCGLDPGQPCGCHYGPRLLR